jgi:hypothetical protein
MATTTATHIFENTFHCLFMILSPLLCVRFHISLQISEIHTASPLCGNVKLVYAFYESPCGAVGCAGARVTVRIAAQACHPDTCCVLTMFNYISFSNSNVKLWIILSLDARVRGVCSFQSSELQRNVNSSAPFVKIIPSELFMSFRLQWACAPSSGRLFQKQT